MKSEEYSKSAAKLMQSDRLEIGSGHNPTPGYLHLDIDPNAPSVDIVGDIRTVFIPQDFPEVDESLAPMKPKSAKEPLLLFRVIKMNQFIEHIHWYNQPAMWHWVNQALDYGGVVEIETPDMEYVIKTYIRNIEPWYNRFLPRRFRRRNIVKYPRDEHPDINGNTDVDLSRWVCYRFHSGGSYNRESGLHDYHLGLYDKRRLDDELRNAGLLPSIKRQNGMLVGRAVKLKPDGVDYYKLRIEPEQSDGS